MKKTILLLAIILLAEQVFAQIPEDLDARVARFTQIAFDESDNKLNGFERVSLTVYMFENETDEWTWDVLITLFSDRRNKVAKIEDIRFYNNTRDVFTYRGKYISELEKRGYIIRRTAEDEYSCLLDINNVPIMIVTMKNIEINGIIYGLHVTFVPNPELNFYIN